MEMNLLQLTGIYLAAMVIIIGGSYTVVRYQKKKRENKEIAEFLSEFLDGNIITLKDPFEGLTEEVSVTTEKPIKVKKVSRKKKVSKKTKKA